MSELALRFKDELLQLPEVDRLELANFFGILSIVQTLTVTTKRNGSPSWIAGWQTWTQAERQPNPWVKFSRSCAPQRTARIRRDENRCSPRGESRVGQIAPLV